MQTYFFQHILQLTKYKKYIIIYKYTITVNTTAWVIRSLFLTTTTKRIYLYILSDCEKLVAYFQVQLDNTGLYL